MAKVTITIEDVEDDNISVVCKFEPPIDDKNLESPTHAVNSAGMILVMMSKLGDVECSVNSPFKSKPKMKGYRITNVTDTSLTITDIGPWDKFPTVTNRIEEVIDELKDLLEGKRLYIVDSEGKKDRVLIENGKFAGWSYGDNE